MKTEKEPTTENSRKEAIRPIGRGWSPIFKRAAVTVEASDSAPAIRASIQNLVAQQSA